MTPFNPALAGWFRLLLVAAVVAVAWQTLTPNPVELPGTDTDKLMHAAAFLGLAFLADAAWPDRPIGWRALALLAAYGAVIELLQGYVPNRSTSALDLAADMAGIALYAALIGPWLRSRPPAR